MIQLGNKGQTALEYLLIVVVAIIVVVAVMVFMNATTEGSIDTGAKQANVVLCRAISCTGEEAIDPCLADECGVGATCEGATSVGGNPIPGHCTPV